MATPEEFAAQAEEAFGKLEALIPELNAAREDGAERFDALKAQVDELGQYVADAKASEEAAKREQEFEALKQQIADIGKEVRKGSKADVIGGNMPADPEEAEDQHFFLALSVAQSPRAPEEQRQHAQKALLAMGSKWSDVPSYSKATLGSTDSTGGYLAPRAVVRDFSTVGVATNPYRSLLTVVTGIVAPSIDVPHIGLAPTRASVVSRGSTKPNVDIATQNYSATFYTLAQIYDAANQWLRQTGGQGERIIRQRLGQALALGEAYYVLNGTGTNEPKGILTSIGVSGTFVTTHTASNSTVAGSAATAIAKASGALANRSRQPDGVVMNAGDFWTMLAQGSDNAGFWVAPAAGPASVNAAGFLQGQPALRLWNSNLGIHPDPNMPADSLVVGAWKEAELYVGEDYRVDSSSEAGTRWDQNLTGFRAEEEIAFNADPYVASGLFQRIIDAVA